MSKLIGEVFGIYCGRNSSNIILIFMPKGIQVLSFHQFSHQNAVSFFPKTRHLSYIIKSAYVTSSLCFYPSFFYLLFPNNIYIYIWYGFLFHISHISSVYFSHHQVGFWFGERYKFDPPVPTKSGYKVIVRIYTQQARDIHFYTHIRKIRIKQTGGTANSV